MRGLTCCPRRPRPRPRPAARLHPAAEKGCVSADRYVSPFTHLRRLLSILSGLTAGRSPLVRYMYDWDECDSGRGWSVWRICPQGRGGSSPTGDNTGSLTGDSADHSRLLSRRSGRDLASEVGRRAERCRAREGAGRDIAERGRAPGGTLQSEGGRRAGHRRAGEDDITPPPRAIGISDWINLPRL